MSGHKLVVNSDELRAVVELDGADISEALRGYSIEHKAGELPQVTLDVGVFDLSSATDGVAAHIPDETRDLLVKLGWTPPEDA